MFRFHFLLGVSCIVAMGCAVVPECPKTTQPTTQPAPEAVNIDGTEPTIDGYEGHGVASVPVEVLEKYAVPPLPHSRTRRIQSMIDITPPSPGYIIAPDGKAFFYDWSVTGSSQIWKLAKPMGYAQQFTGGEDETLPAAILPNGKHLIVYRDRDGEENYGLYLQSVDGGPLEEIQQVEGRTTWLRFVSDDSRYLYFMSNDIKPDSFANYRYDLKTKTKELLFDEEGLFGVTDVRSNGKILVVSLLGRGCTEVFEFDVATKKLMPILGQGEMASFDVSYGVSDDELLVLTDKFGDFSRLYSYKNSKFTPITGEFNFDVTGFELDRSKKRLYYATNENGYKKLTVLNAKNYKPVRLPKLPDADAIEYGDTSYNGRFTVVSIDDGKKPGRSFVIDWRKNKAEAWMEPSTPEIDTSTFAKAKLEHYSAKDGTKIPVWVRSPTECEKKLCPVVVQFHGGPKYQSFPGFDLRAQLFVDAGFVYVSPNVRGSDGYGKKWHEADNGPKRADVITDIQDAAIWARTRFAFNGIEPKLGIYGGSYGGYAVLMGMTMFAGSYDAGVQSLGVSSLVTFMENMSPWGRSLRVAEYGDPEKDREYLLALSPITYIDKVKAPILHIMGATDPRVPIGEAILIHQGLVNRGADSTLLIFKDEGHGIRKRKNRVLNYGHALQFFEKHLKQN